MIAILNEHFIINSDKNYVKVNYVTNQSLDPSLANRCFDFMQMISHSLILLEEVAVLMNLSSLQRSYFPIPLHNLKESSTAVVAIVCDKNEGNIGNNASH